MAKIIHPAYFSIIKREGSAWYFRHGSVFYRDFNSSSIDIKNREELYGLTKARIATELFRIAGGIAGYYLANLKDKQYHYCGLTLDDVKTTLQGLGIGRPDPVEN